MQKSARATAIERHGVESIPDAERDATIIDFARICWGVGRVS